MSVSAEYNSDVVDLYCNTGDSLVALVSGGSRQIGYSYEFSSDDKLSMAISLGPPLFLKYQRLLI